MCRFASWRDEIPLILDILIMSSSAVLHFVLRQYKGGIPLLLHSILAFIVALPHVASNQCVVPLGFYFPFLVCHYRCGYGVA